MRSRLKRWCVCLGLASLSLLYGPASWAQIAPPRGALPVKAALLVPSCAPRALAIAARAELAADGVDAQIYDALAVIDDPELPVLSLELSCDAPTVIIARIEAPATGRFAVHRVPLLGADASTRRRLGALALAELLRAKWPEISQPTQPTPAPPTRPTTPVPTIVAVPKPVPKPPSPVVLDVGAMSRYFTNDSTWLNGAQFSAGPPSLRAGLSVAFGRADNALGQVSLGVAAAHLQSALYRHRGPVDFEIAARVSLGLAWASARSKTALTDDATSLFSSASVIFAARYPLSTRLRLRAELAPGFSQGLRLKADDAVIAELGGPLLTGGLSLGYRF